MTTEELIRKIVRIVMYWEEISERCEDDATNSAAWSYYHGKADAFKQILSKLRSGEDAIERIYENVKNL